MEMIFLTSGAYNIGMPDTINNQRNWMIFMMRTNMDKVQNGELAISLANKIDVAAFRISFDKWVSSDVGLDLLEFKQYRLINSEAIGSKSVIFVEDLYYLHACCAATFQDI